jgi:hypothetical protein
MENLSRLELVLLWKKLKKTHVENIKVEILSNVETAPDLEKAENLLLKKFQIEPSELYF